MTQLELKQVYDLFQPKLKVALDLFVEDLQNKLVDVPVNITYKARIKEFDSFFAKVLKRSKGNELPFRLVRDLIAVRLICPFKEDVDVLEDYLRQQYKVVEIDRKGTQFSFREFGYRSTHLEVELDKNYRLRYKNYRFCCEVQVRTILQDAWCEVEHELVYKNKLALNDNELRHKMAALNANLTLSDIIFQEIRSYQKQLRSKMDMRQSRLQQQIDELLLSDTTGLPAKKMNLLVQGDALLMEAISAHDAGRYQKAGDLYTKLLEGELPPLVKGVVLVNRGMVYLSCQLQPEAEADFILANQIQPTAVACYYLGILFLLKKQYSQALVFFNESLALNAEQPQALLGKARAYLKLQNYNQALVSCEEALVLSPDLETALTLKESLSSLSV